MAQSYVSADTGELVIPGSVASIKVQAAAAGLATSGVLLLVGEADAGPDWSLESKLSNNSFGPDQFGAVQAKYGSGPLVDAFLQAANPLADERIAGSFSRAVLVKTNVSHLASANLLMYDSSTYKALQALNYGQLGNLISYSTAASIAEVLPTTGSFTWIPTVGTCAVGFRVNGGDKVSATIGANATPAAAVAAVDGLSGVAATGGAARVVIPVVIAGNITATAASPNLTIATSASWTTIPTAGDTLFIPVGSAIAGAGTANVGAYVVVSATSNSIVATKLSQAGKAGATPGDAVTVATVGSTPILATTDFTVAAPVVFTLEAGNPLAGVGKSLEICELTTGTDLLSRAAFALSVTPTTWVSKTGSPKLVVSGAEHQATLTVARSMDNVNETVVAGGEIALKVSYTGTTASMTIGASTLTTTVTGGSGGNLSLVLANFPTIGDLADYINAQVGYKCAVWNSALGQQAPSALDMGTFGICSEFGEYNGRIKDDARRWFQAMSASTLVQMAEANAGLPGPTTVTAYLSGGARGATTAAGITSALLALEKVRGNFLVPLFSRDASADKADGITDSASDYTISGIHQGCRSHVLAMSKVKRRKNRQAFVSIRDTFANAKNAAGNMAAARATVSFLDQKCLSSDGTVKQFQPWMDSVIAAAGQASGFYRAMVRKTKNISGSLQAAGDWDDQNDSQVEDALKAGLLPTRQHDNGSWYFVSDQTSYSRDSNFVYNSFQAVYVADTIAMTAAQRMEDQFAGESVADVSAAAALTFLEGIMADFLRLKLIAPSDDAPLGFKNASVVISGPAMVVNIEVKLAGAIYFIPLSFLVSQVSQTATQG